MSNYRDLAKRIIDYTGTISPDVHMGVREALAYLDMFPDQVPGRTITESELEAHDAGMGQKTRDCLERMLDRLGITVVPDPVPTNAELLVKLIRSAGRDMSEHDLAEYLTAWGVKAGGDDE